MQDCWPNKSPRNCTLLAEALCSGSKSWRCQASVSQAAVCCVFKCPRWLINLGEERKGLFSPSSSLQDSAHHGNDVCVFLRRPRSDSPEEAAGQKKEGEAAVKGEHDDSPLIALGCKWETNCADAWAEWGNATYRRKMSVYCLVSEAAVCDWFKGAITFVFVWCCPACVWMCSCVWEKKKRLEHNVSSAATQNMFQRKRRNNSGGFVLPTVRFGLTTYL